MSDIKTLFKKFFAINSKPNKETFPELPDMIIWLRFMLGVFYGLSLGIGNAGNKNNSPGGPGILFGLNFITFIPILYCNLYLGADSDSYGTKLFFSGVLNSVALLLLIWIYFYTLDHVDDEMKLIDALVLPIVGINNNNNGDDGGDETIIDDVQTEF